MEMCLEETHLELSASNACALLKIFSSFIFPLFICKKKTFGQKLHIASDLLYELLGVIFNKNQQHKLTYDESAVLNK